MEALWRDHVAQTEVSIIRWYKCLPRTTWESGVHNMRTRRIMSIRYNEERLTCLKSMVIQGG
jgi:hypothetical protein